MRLQGESTLIEIHETQAGELVRHRMTRDTQDGFLELELLPGANAPMLAALTIERDR
jgi:hypothetical protein